MTDINNLAKIIEKAWDQKDEATLRQYLHPEYTSCDPMTTVKGIDKTIEKMKAFSLEGELEVKRFITQDDTNVLEGVWHLESPFKADIPYVSIKRFENEKLIEQNIYFDTGKLPK